MNKKPPLATCKSTKWYHAQKIQFASNAVLPISLSLPQIR